MGNPFVHVELMSTNVGKAKTFYSKLFDWKLEDMDMGDMTYTMIKVGEGTGGGLMKNPMPNAGSMWVAYVNVDDLRSRGGRLVQHHHRSDRSDVGPLGAERKLALAQNLRKLAALG